MVAVGDSVPNSTRLGGTKLMGGFWGFLFHQKPVYKSLDWTQPSKNAQFLDFRDIYYIIYICIYIYIPFCSKGPFCNRGFGLWVKRVPKHLFTGYDWSTRDIFFLFGFMDLFLRNMIIQEIIPDQYGCISKQPRLKKKLKNQCSPWVPLVVSHRHFYPTVSNHADPYCG